MDKKFLTDEQAISQFGLDAGQFHQLVEDGELRALADRGTWKFRRDEIEGLIQEGLLTATSPSGDAVQAPDIDSSPDDLSYLELDEDALTEGATIVRKSADLQENDPEISAVPELTSQDSPVILEANESIAANSDSDVTIMEGAPAQQGSSPDDLADRKGAEQVTIVEKPAGEASGSDSNVRIADSGVSLEAPDGGLVTDASGILYGDSAIRAAESGVTLRPVDSGISLEDDSSLTFEGSGIDSGLPLESAEPDSGLTLDAPDSGIRLDTAADSGIQLDAGTDSGIQLEADSGIQLGGPGSDIPIASRTHSRADDTQPEFEISDDELAMGDSGDQTMLIALDDEEDSLETLPPTKKPASLSDAFDSAAEVEDLDLVEDLDADAIEEDEEFVEDVLEASDEAFSIDDAGEVSEEAVSAASVVVPASASREPSWGIAAILPVAATSLLLAVNSLMLWDAMATMWNGESGQALSIGIINALGDLI